MTRQAINVGFPNPNFVNETATQQAILPGVYLNETSASGAQPFDQTDWPAPNAAPASIGLRTFTQSTPLNLKDTFFGLAGHPNYDWPVPRGAARASVLGTWTQSPNLGQDKFFGLAGNPNTDWPVPKGPIPAISLRTWTDPLKLLLQDKLFGLAGNPNYDWPNPRSAVPAISLRTWTDPVKLNLLGKDQFFGAPGEAPAYDWQNPRAATPAIDLRTWLQGVSLSSRAAVVYPATITFDWPNPRGALPGVALKTWIDPLKLELLGQDQFFGAAGQVPANLDWPVPKGASRAIDLTTWDNGFSLVTQPVVVQVPRQPLITRITVRDPAGVAVRAETEVWQNTLLTLNAPVVIPATFHFDWPNPRGATPAAINLRAEIYPLNINITPVTPPPPPPPPPQPGSPTRPSGGWDWPYQDPNDKPAHARRKKNYAKARYEEDQVLQLLHMMDKADDDELDEMLSDAGYPELVQRDDEDNGTRH